MPFRCQPFDLDDRALIEGARRTGHPPHVAAAIQAAVSGFRKRVSARPFSIVNGEIAVLLIKPQTFFDDYCSAIVLQELSESTRLPVMRVMVPASADLKRPASPDVIFDPPELTDSLTH